MLIKHDEMVGMFQVCVYWDYDFICGESLKSYFKKEKKIQCFEEIVQIFADLNKYE